MRARSSLSLGISAICASWFVGSTQAMRPKAEEQRDTSNPRYPGMSEDPRPRRARECGMRHRQHPRAGLVAPVSSEARGGGMLPYYQDGTLFSEAGTWGWREVAVVWLIAAAGLACIWFA